MDKNVHGSIVYHSQILKIGQLSLTREWIDNLIYNTHTDEYHYKG